VKLWQDDPGLIGPDAPAEDIADHIYGDSRYWQEPGTL
jgi:hypothetical protein